MKVPVDWLRDYVAIDVPLPELANRLAVSTCEVERISRRGVPARRLFPQFRYVAALDTRQAFRYSRLF